MKRFLFAIVLLSSSLWATCNFNATVDNTWENGSNWSGCAGTGGIPATTDTPIIGAHTLTVASAQTVTGITGTNAAAVLHILNGGNLNTTGTAANSVNFTTAGAQITIDAGGTFEPGGGGAAVSQSSYFSGITINVSGILLLNQTVSCANATAIHLHAGSSLLSTGNGAYQILVTIASCTIDDDAASWGTIPDGTAMSAICPANAATYNTICISSQGSTQANFLQLAGGGSTVLNLNLQHVNLYNIGPTGTTGVNAANMTWNNVHWFSPGALRYSPQATGSNWSFTNVSIAGMTGGFGLYCSAATAIGTNTRLFDHLYIYNTSITTGEFEPGCSNITIQNSVIEAYIDVLVGSPNSDNLTIKNSIMGQSPVGAAAVQWKIPYNGNMLFQNNWVIATTTTANMHPSNTTYAGTAGPNLFINNVYDGNNSAGGSKNSGYGYLDNLNNSGTDIFADNLLVHIGSIRASAHTLTINNMSAKHLIQYDSIYAPTAGVEIEGNSSPYAIAYNKDSLYLSVLASSTTGATPSPTSTRLHNGICQVSTTSPITTSGGAVTIPITGCTSAPTTSDSITFGKGFAVAAFLRGGDCHRPSAASSSSITCVLNYPAVTPVSYSATETVAANVYVGYFYNDNNIDSNGNGSSTIANLYDYVHGRAGSVFVYGANPPTATNLALAATAVTATSGSPATSVTIASGPSNALIGDWAYCDGANSAGNHQAMALVTAITGTGPTTFTLGHNSVGGTGLTTSYCTAHNLLIAFNMWDATTCPNTPDCYGSQGMGSTETALSSQFRNTGYDINAISTSLGGAGTAADFLVQVFKCGGMDQSGNFVSTSINQAYCNQAVFLAGYQMAWGSMNGQFKNSEPDGRDKGVSGWVYPAAIQSF